ncbi:hypothetical protein [Gordonia aurantiaca]
MTSSARAKDLAGKYGDNFLPPASLVEKAEQGITTLTNENLVKK